MNIGDIEAVIFFLCLAIGFIGVFYGYRQNESIYSSIMRGCFYLIASLVIGGSIYTLAT